MAAFLSSSEASNSGTHANARAEEPSECPHSIRTLFETKQVDPGQRLELELSINSDMYKPTRSDYLGVYVHSETSHKNYIAYQYLTVSDEKLSVPHKVKSFSEVVVAPSKPGIFEIRFYQYGATEPLLRSQQFRVGPTTRLTVEESLSNSTVNSFAVGVFLEKGCLDQDSAWIGLYVAGEPSNKNFIETKYLKQFIPLDGLRPGSSADVIFKKPRDFTRNYEVRLFPFRASSWDHSDQITFRLSGAIDFVFLDVPSSTSSSSSSTSSFSSSSSSSVPSKMRLKKGSTIKIGCRFQSFEPSAWDWVSIAQTSLPPLQYNSYQYVVIDPRSESSINTITLTLPQDVGIYELRYFIDNTQPLSRSSTFFIVD